MLVIAEAGANHAVYATTVGPIKHASFVGDRTNAVIVPKERSVVFDDAVDLQLARLLAH